MREESRLLYRMTNAVRRRAGRGLMALLLALALIPLGSAPVLAATGDSGSVLRETHQVAVGKTKYCVFVTKNVVLTPAEISSMTDDELTSEIMKRAGLYLRESNCTLDSHKDITAESWIKGKHSFVLSEADLASLRQASPSDGSPVKLYLDPGISPDPVPKAKPETEPEKDPEKEPETDPTDPEDKPDPGTGEDPASGGDDSGNTGSDSSGSDSGEEGNTGSDSSDEGGTGGENSGTDENTSDADKTEDNSDNKDGESSGDQKDDEKSGDENSGEESGTRGGKTSEENETKERTVYPTFRLTSPSLLFVVVATEGDASYQEPVCKEKTVTPTPQKPTKPSNPGIGPVDPGEGEEDTMLPEFRSISMVDKSGKPIQATLEDGEPVTLEWIDPAKRKDDGEHSSPVRVIIAIAALAAIAGGIFLYRRREEK